MIPFVNTGYGRALFESHLPRAIDALDRLVSAVETLAASHQGFPRLDELPWDPITLTDTEARQILNNDNLCQHGSELAVTDPEDGRPWALCWVRITPERTSTHD